jgi:hypothetical protein
MAASDVTGPVETRPLITERHRQPASTKARPTPLLAPIATV